MSGEPLADARVQAVLDIPLHRFLGVELRDRQDPSAGIRFQVGTASENPARLLHGGVVYALLDVASFLALLPSLGPGEHAVTHDVAASLLRPVSSGATVDVVATVLRRGRAVAFMRAEATVDGVLVASGQVTKSVVPLR
ncbi:PaaI family thioesterase [Blastococcus sp. TF02A_35]|uniref:PaaI family thioesterase n=1 Tax=Blastococcus sp. TF02A-35 TaxID=2559612 RepID=UPI0010733338|nr:PaaI family thioesterase [Blastococcus sp. TF02A_35]TFV51880.1 PaaI family thioesterase [Blastococcus sp. TF02A_35]